MHWFDLIFFSLVGLLFFITGWFIWKKDKIWLIYRYYTIVKEEGKKPYTAAIGKALVLISAGSFVTGVINFAFSTTAGWILFLVCFLLGFARILTARKKYKDGLF